MKQIIVLTDYQEHFGSKYNAVPYNSGMDKKLLIECFAKYNIELVFMNFSKVHNYKMDFWKNKLVVYTSSEDYGYFYKSFIEDIICYLELVEACVIPSYKYLRANNNKVFMELLRHSFLEERLQNISSKVFGCLEELETAIGELKYPLVYKD